jgi:flagellar hook assembly protein FlgD
LPSNLKIQILSPSGKIVKEILKSDLGPLHIGTNITEYKWKGDDQFGQPLGNGVYLYRVVSNLHGEQLEHYKRSNSQNADKWIEKGFGKLYIMR